MARLATLDQLCEAAGCSSNCSWRGARRSLTKIIIERKNMKQAALMAFAVVFLGACGDSSNVASSSNQLPQNIGITASQLTDAVKNPKNITDMFAAARFIASQGRVLALDKERPKFAGTLLDSSVLAEIEKNSDINKNYMWEKIGSLPGFIGRRGYELQTPVGRFIIWTVFKEETGVGYGVALNVETKNAAILEFSNKNTEQIGDWLCSAALWANRAYLWVAYGEGLKADNETPVPSDSSRLMAVGALYSVERFVFGATSKNITAENAPAQADATETTTQRHDENIVSSIPEFKRKLKLDRGRGINYSASGLFAEQNIGDGTLCESSTLSYGYCNPSMDNVVFNFGLLSRGGESAIYDLRGRFGCLTAQADQNGTVYAVASHIGACR